MNKKETFYKAFEINSTDHYLAMYCCTEKGLDKLGLEIANRKSIYYRGLFIIFFTLIN